MKGVLEPSRKLYERAVELARSPNQAPYLDLGNVYRGLNKPDLALEQYEKAIDLKPYSLAENFNLGHILHMRRDPRGTEYLQRAIRLFEEPSGRAKPEQKAGANALQAISYAYAATGKVKKAQELLAKAIKAATKERSKMIFSSTQYRYIPVNKFIEETSAS